MALIPLVTADILPGLTGRKGAVTILGNEMNPADDVGRQWIDPLDYKDFPHGLAFLRMIRFILKRRHQDARTTRAG